MQPFHVSDEGTHMVSYDRAHCLNYDGEDQRDGLSFQTPFFKVLIFLPLLIPHIQVLLKYWYSFSSIFCIHPCLTCICSNQIRNIFLEPPKSFVFRNEEMPQVIVSFFYFYYLLYELPSSYELFTF